MNFPYLKGFKLRRKLLIQIIRCCIQYNNKYVNDFKKNVNKNFKSTMSVFQVRRNLPTF